MAKCFKYVLCSFYADIFIYFSAFQWSWMLRLKFMYIYFCWCMHVCTDVRVYLGLSRYWFKILQIRMQFVFLCIMQFMLQPENRIHCDVLDFLLSQDSWSFRRSKCISFCCHRSFIFVITISIFSCTSFFNIVLNVLSIFEIWRSPCYVCGTLMGVGRCWWCWPNQTDHPYACSSSSDLLIVPQHVKTNTAFHMAVPCF